MMDSLFSRVDWFSVCQGRKDAMREEINALDADRILNTSVDALCKYFEDKNAIEVPVIDCAQVAVETHETKRRVNDFGRNTVVPSTEIEVSVPFDGPSDAFGIQPSTHIVGMPRATVVGNVITFRVDAFNCSDQQVKTEIERTLDQIEQQLTNLRKDVSQFLPEV